MLKIPALYFVTYIVFFIQQKKTIWKHKKKKKNFKERKVFKYLRDTISTAFPNIILVVYMTFRGWQYIFEFLFVTLNEYLKVHS